MGKAIIEENIGEGLYKVRIVPNSRKLYEEYYQLEDEKTKFWRDLLTALNHQDLLQADVAMYSETLHALMEQWQQGLLDKNQTPPPIVPEDADGDSNNPNTGLPYTDDERADALENEVLDKINAARVAAGLAPFERSQTLDNQASDRITKWKGPPIENRPDLTSNDYQKMLLQQQSIGEEGRTMREGLIDNALGVVSDLVIDAAGSGQLNSNKFMEAIQRDTATWNKLMKAEVTAIGIRYQYNPEYPGTHNWGISALAPSATLEGNADFFASAEGEALLAEIEAILGPDMANSLKPVAEQPGEAGAGANGSWGDRWQPNTHYGAGTKLIGWRREPRPEPLNETLPQRRERLSENNRITTDPCFCLALSAGLSGGNEPSWPHHDGPENTVADNEITWKVLAGLPRQMLLVIAQWGNVRYEWFWV